MPNQNQNNTGSNINPISTISPQADLPPMPPEFQNVTTTTTTTTQNAASTSGAPAESSAPQVTLPPIISSTPRKKFGGGRIIATLLGILLLVGGVGAGLILTSQKQLFQQKAANPPYVGPVPDVTVQNVGSGQVAEGCVVENLPGQNGNTSGSNQAVGRLAGCGSNTGGGGGGQSTGCYPGSNPGVRTITRIWVSNDNQTPTAVTIKFNLSGGNDATIRGSTYFAYSTNSNFSGAITKSWGGTIKNNIHVGCTLYDSDACVRVTGLTPNINYYFKAGTMYSDNQTSYSCGEQVTTLFPSATAQCQNVKAYDSSWNSLTSTQLSALKVGTAINFCVAGSASSGSFDKARFTINGTLEADTTSTRPNSSDFCQAYTIPSGMTSFTVSAQIHHTTLGWSN